ncbi:MAG: FUSC family protein, partial [Actinomycetota bacterium]|nr:FUSC family protein [Actinomycetota bacterium]
RGHESPAAIVGMLLFAGGAGIAIGTGMPHGYWIPLTLVVVIPPMLQDDTHRGRKRLLGTVMGVVLVIPLSLIPMPPWLFYVVGFVLLVPALVIMKRSYTFYAFLESAAVVMLVSAGNDVLGTDEARLAGTAIALVAVTAVVVSVLARRLPPEDVPPQVLAP